MVRKRELTRSEIINLKFFLFLFVGCLCLFYPLGVYLMGTPDLEIFIGYIGMWVIANQLLIFLTMR